MKVLSMPALRGLPSLAPIVTRVIVGIIMAAHGLQKLAMGPAMFGEGMLSELGVPAPVFFGWVVTLVELGGGVLLILGLVSRLAALALAANLVVALLLVKTDVGLIAEMGAALPGAELDLALIAGFLTVLFLGPGRLSVDHAIGLEHEEGTGAARGSAGAPTAVTG